MKNTITKGASRGWGKDRARGFARKGICGLFASLLLCGGHAPASAQTQTSPQPQASRYTATEQANRETVRRAYAAWARGGTKFFDILAPNVIWTIKGSGKNAVTYRSKAAFLKSIEPFQARLASPIVPTVRQIFVDGDQVIILWDGRAPTKDG